MNKKLLLGIILAFLGLGLYQLLFLKDIPPEKGKNNSKFMQTKGPNYLGYKINDRGYFGDRLFTDIPQYDQSFRYFIGTKEDAWTFFDRNTASWSKAAKEKELLSSNNNIQRIAPENKIVAIFNPNINDFWICSVSFMYNDVYKIMPTEPFNPTQSVYFFDSEERRGFFHDHMHDIKPPKFKHDENIKVNKDGSRTYKGYKIDKDGMFGEPDPEANVKK